MFVVDEEIYVGSGKTTFLHRLVCDLQASKSKGYVVNLDPAVMTLPFGGRRILIFEILLK